MKTPLLINKNSPIGIFDSGLGGLTVLQKMQEILPHENYIYFGDTAHLPYGSKSNQCIEEYSRKIINFLLSKNVKAIIIACNSASSVANETIKNIYDIPIFEVITPSVIEAIDKTKTNHICVIGTETTISSNMYSKKIYDKNSNIKTIEIACPLLVPIIEEGLENSKIAYEMVKLYLNPIIKSDVDTLILGCTHYPIIINILKKIFVEKVDLISSGAPVSQYVHNFLKQNNNESSNKNGSVEFYVSDAPDKFQKLGSKFLNDNIANITVVEF